MFLKFIKRLFCDHDTEFIRNIYGDEILLTGARSIWKCKKCGALAYNPLLNRDVIEKIYYCGCIGIAERCTHHNQPSISNE